MADHEPRPDIDYSMQREALPKFIFLPKEFDQQSYSYEDVLVSDLLIPHQPYDLNKYSPTPLDPFHIRIGDKDYLTSANAYMEGRFTEIADEIGLSELHRQRIMAEVNHEHLERSIESNEAMKRMRGAIEPTMPIDPITAELIFKKRAALAELKESVYLLAAYPEAEAFEVIKYTAPLESDEIIVTEVDGKKVKEGKGLAFAHAQFMFNLSMLAETNPNIIVERTCGESPRPRKSDATGLTNIFITKGKEADIHVNGVHLELIGRYSFYVPTEHDPAFEKVQPTMAVINDKPVAMYSIALSKYLRVAKSTE